MHKFSKVNEDGGIDVAVLISIGGGEWFTSHEREDLLYHPGIVKIILDLQKTNPELSPIQIQTRIKEGIGDHQDIPHIPYLSIAWIPTGTKFTVLSDEITLGAEQILIHDACIWLNA